MKKLFVVLLAVFAALGGVGTAPRETSANAGAIAAGVAVMAAGVGVSIGGCVALQAATKPDAPTVLPPPPPEQW